MKKNLNYIILLIICLFGFIDQTNASYIGSYNFYEGYNNWNSNSPGLIDIMDIIGIIIIAITIFIWYKIIRKIFVWKEISTPKLVLTKLELDESDEIMVRLEWRQWGFWNFILSTLKIENKYTFLVEKENKRISYEGNSLNGTKKITIDFDKISSVNVWFYQPKVFLIICLIVWIATIIGIIWIFIIIFWAIYFYIKKEIYMIYESAWWDKLKISVSPSIIERISFDIEKAKRIEEIICDLKK